jgi:hypothetical protein
LGALTSALKPKSALALTGSARTSTRGASTLIWGALTLNPKSAFALTGSARTSTLGAAARTSSLGAFTYTSKPPYSLGAETLAFTEVLADPLSLFRS